MQALSRTALSCAVVLALSTTIDAHAHTSAPASAAAPAADGTTATGAILGQVLDPATGQYLRNARIKIDGREVALSGDRGQFRITGLNGQGESSELALLLRAGGLAAPMYFAEERTLGPSLGAENIQLGIDASLWGFLFVSLFMVAIYKFFGLLATVALAFNMVLLVALMSLLGATLTLPGIAGIVLTMGMAVDANVLIYSRIREEIGNGMSIQRAIHEGFDRAFSAILDGNLTTLLVGGILFVMGTGPIKGFAVTMSLGIVTSMFTAIIVTRGMVNLIFGGRDIKKLWI